MSETPLSYNTDQSKPEALHQIIPLLSESQRQNFGPFSPVTNADACAVLNHLLRLSSGARERKLNDVSSA